ncbi:MAG: hypothetical protein AAF483_06845 [Planctomycetota bacterium]
MATATLFDDAVQDSDSAQLLLPFETEWASEEWQPETEQQEFSGWEETVIPSKDPRPTVAGAFPKAEPGLNEPVKMGAFMMQLLKSYGITDEEIQEGLANYAMKQAVATAC